jgi:hypothetical protein
VYDKDRMRCSDRIFCRSALAAQGFASPLQDSLCRALDPPVRSRGKALIGATQASKSWTDVSILEYNVSDI